MGFCCGWGWGLFVRGGFCGWIVCFFICGVEIRLGFWRISWFFFIMN